MVTSIRLATKPASAIPAILPLPVDDQNGQIAWYQIGSPHRIMALLRATVEARAPVGYEDEAGFHYGTDATDWFFSI